MTRPYSEDLRARAVARHEAGETTRAVAAALAISPSCVTKWTARRRETGSLAPGQVGGHKKPSLSGETATWLRERCRSGAFTTRGLPAEQTRPDIARKRARWKARQGRIAPGRLVFLDETWVKTNMAPLRGWGPRGRRLEAHVPHGHWKTLTFIAALRADRVEAPWVIDGPINGELFTLYVEKALVPTLAKGDIVILDNLNSHKAPAARRAIRAAGAHMLFLPAYSPDLNPIEQFFAKLKHLLRGAEPRTVEDAWRKIGQLLDLFSPDECANYLVNSGYASI